MLNEEDNERISHVGPGTEMGNVMRQYWVPALAASELPGPDCDPVRVLLLGEKLIAYKDTNGKVGLISDACPHRGASLFFGRNEEAGLRCVYHGWKFDVDGNTVDMPNEPAESNFKSKVKAVTYPTQERGGVIWTYMGPRETPPPMPDIEATMLPEGVATLRLVQQRANYLQVLEGNIDTSHLAFLHMGGIEPTDWDEGTFGHYVVKHRAPKYEIVDTAYGTMYGAFRDADPGKDYWRVAQFLFPFYTMPPAGVLGLNRVLLAHVPMDDEHTMNFFWSASPVQRDPKLTPVGAFAELEPNTTGWLGRFNPVARLANDYFIDRDAQRAGRGVIGYTGIKSGGLQDQAIVESMTPIVNRSLENLGTADSMIIRTRARLLATAEDLANKGTTPPGVDEPESYRVRSGGVFLPKGADWIEETKSLVEAFVEHPELDATIGSNA